MIAAEYNDFIKNLFIEGMEKDKAKKKFMNKWQRENIDLVWKEQQLARKTFEQQWEILSEWDETRLVQEKRKKVLQRLTEMENE
ncbi:MAG: hypothetical protein ACW99U_20975 [Candidatus Thorarchaeota archaeon]|jgi:hypothetical protein